MEEEKRGVGRRSKAESVKRLRRRKIAQIKKSFFNSISKGKGAQNTNTIPLATSTPGSSSHRGINLIRSATDTNNRQDIFMNSDIYSDSDSFKNPSSDNESVGENTILKIKEELINWSQTFNIAHVSLTSLLNILSRLPDLSSLPRDARTLLKTPRHIEVKEVAGGKYSYFGIARGIEQVLSKSSVVLKHYPLIERTCDTSNLLTISINIDGLPVCDSSHISLWPILARVDQTKERYPFVVALFEAPSKPTSAAEYLADFVKEVKLLEIDGIVLKNIAYTFRVSCIIADAPARAFIKETLSHNAFHGCGKCTQIGTHLGRTVWPYANKASLRTDDAFAHFQYKNHQVNLTVLNVLNIGLVSQVPLDAMHLVYLGVMKKLISIWVGGPKITCRHAKLTTSKIQELNQRLLFLKHSMPAEFHRKPRPISDYKFWKATEFRAFLLYIGPIVLKGILIDSLYDHFMLLHSAIYLLTDPHIVEHLDKLWYSNELIHCFVSSLATVYSPELCLYNFHSLLHLTDDVRNFGCLDGFSAFPFENHMNELIRKIRAPNKPLQQIMKRLGENVFPAKRASRFFNFKKIIHTGHGKVVQKFRDSNIAGGSLVSCEVPDNCFILSGRRLIIIRKIFLDEDNIMLQFYELTEKFNVFLRPSASSNLNIFKVKLCQTDSLTLKVMPANSITKKCLLLPDVCNVNYSIVMPFASMEIL